MSWLIGDNEVKVNDIDVRNGKGSIKEIAV
jgi:hypothetical protein